jgi:hypothetical protein
MPRIASISVSTPGMSASLSMIFSRMQSVELPRVDFMPEWSYVFSIMKYPWMGNSFVKEVSTGLHCT